MISNDCFAFFISCWLLLSLNRKNNPRLQANLPELTDCNKHLITMSIVHNKDIGTKQKALAINLDPKIYGSFAEIGAGQDVAANFFKAGASSGTIAKTMSAYDMTVSDAIYGALKVKRYVSESRLMAMLDHEYSLLVERLAEQRGSNTTFFAFSDTVSTLNYHKTNEAHGWLGVRFQLEPNGPFNDVVLHVNLLDNDNILQQQAVGVLGVNLI